MTITRKAAQIVLRTVTAGFAVGAFTATSPADDVKDGELRPNLSGAWTIVADETDDASKAIEILTSPPGPRDGEGRDPMRGPAGRPMGGPMGGGMGRPHGGWGGGMGGGRGHGPDGGFTPPTPEERAAMRDAIREALEAPPALKITQTDEEIVLEANDSTRRLITDGKKHENKRVTRKAQWKKDKLVIETQAMRTKITETYSLEIDAGQLVVEARAENPRFSGQVSLKRLYSRASETQPQDAARPEDPQTSNIGELAGPSSRDF